MMALNSVRMAEEDACVTIDPSCAFKRASKALSGRPLSWILC